MLLLRLFWNKTHQNEREDTVDTDRCQFWIWDNCKVGRIFTWRDDIWHTGPGWQPHCCSLSSHPLLLLFLLLLLLLFLFFLLLLFLILLVLLLLLLLLPAVAPTRPGSLLPNGRGGQPTHISCGQLSFNRKTNHFLVRKWNVWLYAPYATIFLLNSLRLLKVKDLALCNCFFNPGLIQTWNS